MIISKYGKLFLDYYNKKNNSDICPKDFVLNEVFPMLYSGNIKHLFVMNSPFNNPSNAKLGYDEKVKLFLAGVEEGKSDASFIIGSYANGLDSTTSYNISLDYIPKYSADDIYYSWIGGCLSVSLDTNNIHMLFDKVEILYDIYLGWKKLNNLSNNLIYKDYADGQITTWNGLWLEYYAKKQKKPYLPDFNPYATNSSGKRLNNVSWVSLFFNMANLYDDIEVNSYAYRYQKDNVTYGNVLIYLKKMNNLMNYYKSQFADSDYINTTELYSKICESNSFDHVCRTGVIGLIPFKPRILMLEEYVRTSKTVDAEKKKCYKQYNAYHYKIINLYIMSKLQVNNDEINKIVNLFYDLIDDKKTKSNGRQMIEKFWKVNNMTGLYGVLTEMASYANSEQKNVIEQIRRLFKNRNNDEFREIIALLKYEFTINKK